MGICECSPKKQNNNYNNKNENFHNYLPPIKRVDSSEYFPSNKYEKKEDNLILNNDVIISDSGFNPETVYQKIKLLGEGSYGEVWQVRHKTLGKDFAMKIIEKSPNCQVNEIKNEIEILKQLDHPNILKIIDFLVSSDKFYIITDYCSKDGLIHDILKRDIIRREL